MAVVGWGSTFGPINQAVRRARDDGHEVSQIHIRHIFPLPSNLGDLLAGFDRVLVPEMNNGQLLTLLRSTYAIPGTDRGWPASWTARPGNGSGSGDPRGHH